MCFFPSLPVVQVTLKESDVVDISHFPKSFPIQKPPSASLLGCQYSILLQAATCYALNPYMCNYAFSRCMPTTVFREQTPGTEMWSSLWSFSTHSRSSWLCMLEDKGSWSTGHKTRPRLTGLPLKKQQGLLDGSVGKGTWFQAWLGPFLRTAWWEKRTNPQNCSLTSPRVGLSVGFMSLVLTKSLLDYSVDAWVEGHS